jgi:CRP-like cAMP-binding protein
MRLQKFEVGENIIDPKSEEGKNIYIVASGKVKYSKYEAS